MIIEKSSTVVEWLGEKIARIVDKTFEKRSRIVDWSVEKYSWNWRLISCENCLKYDEDEF